MAFSIEKIRADDYGSVAPQLNSVETADPFAYVDLIQEPENCTLHVARNEGRVVAYLHLYQQKYAIYRLAGDADGASMLLKNIGSGPAILMCQAHLMEAMKSAFPSAPSYMEYLMTVGREEENTSGSDSAVRLEPAYAEQLFNLYASGEFSSRTAFNSIDSYRALLESEPTFGILDDFKLVSAATAFSGSSSFGMVGGVFTSREHRGKGYGTSVASAATRHVLSVSDNSLLYVRTDNGNAISAYEKIGYRHRERWAFFDIGTGIVP